MNKPVALIIEDEEDIALLFAEALQAAKFETEIINNGQTAADRLQAVTPDIVILDLHLPGMSGERILSMIRTDARLANTRVIIASADPRTIGLLESEADVALVKPVTFSQLRDLATRLQLAG